jgi:hypothetical protein
MELMVVKRFLVTAKLLAATVIAAVFLSGCAASPTADTEETIQPPAGASSTGDYEPNYSTAFDSKWGTDFSRRELIETALYKMFSDLDEIRNDECPLEYEAYFGEPMLEEHEYLLHEIANGMISSYCDYMTDDIQVVAGRYEFAKQVVAEQGLPSDEFGGVIGFDLQEDYAMASVWHDLAWIGISLGSKRDGVPFIEERRLTIAAHEIFHIVHEQIDPYSSASKSTCNREEAPPDTTGDRCFRPTWFVEGSGEFFGRAMTQYLGLQNYATFVPNDRSGYYMDPEYLSDLGAQSIRGSIGQGVEAYYSGAIATEFILANIGLKAYLDIWKQMGEGESFFDAFENSAGIDIPTFHDKFRELHLRLYEEAGYCDSSVGCSSWTPSDQLPEIPGLTGLVNHTGSGARLVRESDGQGVNGGDECERQSSVWWLECQGIPFPLPEIPENSDHGYPTEYERIPKVDTCSKLEEVYGEIPGFAATEAARASAGAPKAHVSTEYYAMLAVLDRDRDGVVCSDEAPEE